MSLTLKSKITLGSIFLFALLLLVGIMSVYYISRLTNDSSAIIRDNYESLDYSRQMLAALDEYTETGQDTLLAAFETALLKQEQNVTEPGEGEYTLNIRNGFSALKIKKDTTATLRFIRKNVDGIVRLNLDAIQRKNAAADQTAENSKAVIILILTVSIVSGLTFLFNFPALVATPLARLTEGIKAIANKNYSQRIHLNRTDEFGDLAAAFNSMAEKLDEYENSNLARLLFEKNRAETVINSLKDASIGLGVNNTVLFANAEALQLLNLKEQEIAGENIENVQKKNDLFRFLIHETSTIPFKVILEGKENYFIKEVIPINRAGEKLGELITLRNITPFKEQDVAKTNFIATISHELKTPLASSDFSLKLLEDQRTGTLNSEQKELLQNLRNDNQRLLRILSELLDLTQVESGKMQLNMKLIPAIEVIGKAINTVEALAKDKNIKICSEDIDPSLTLYTDAEKMVWILNNFLTNAIRYSNENEKVWVRVLTENKEARISVQDSGPGIDPVHLPRIFERFYRVPGTQKKGTGLGLAISREFAESMKCSINVESEPGKGSIFSISIPIDGTN